SLIVLFFRHTPSTSDTYTLSLHDALPILSMKDCLDSIEKVLLGPERKSHILSAEEKRVTAYHEGGHALVGHSIPEADPIHKVSIDRKSTRLNSSHVAISYAVFCLKKKKKS